MRKWIATLMALVLVLSTVSMPALADEVDIWAAYDEPVTIHTVKSDLVSIVYPEGDDIHNNAWTRYYKSKFNIDVVCDWVSDDYNTKINLTIAENNLPDAFTVSYGQLQQLVEADMVMDMTEVINTYASDTLKGFFAADQTSFDSGKTDGKQYGIPQLGNGNLSQPDFLWIRKDWMEECGLSAPQTMDDVVTIAKTFMQKYGGYGIASEKSLEFLNLLAIGWGAHPNFWLRNDEGKIVFGSVQPEMKAALADWAEWYKEGILSADFATTDTLKINEDVLNGKVGMMPYYQWWGWALGTDMGKANGMDAMFYPYAIPSANGEQVVQSIYCDNSSYLVVSKDCKNPEAVIKLLNLYAYIISGDALGDEDQAILDDLDKGSEVTHSVYGLRVFNPNLLLEEYLNTTKALETNDTSVLVTVGQWGNYNSIQNFLAGDPSGAGSYFSIGYENSTYKQSYEFFNNGQCLENVLWAATPQALIDYGSTLGDILTEGFTKIIIGDQPIEYFDTVVANWEAAGGAQATQEMNELYNK